MSKWILAVLFFLLSFVFALNKSWAHEEHHAYIDLEKLPLVAVKIHNNTNAFLSLTITNAPCAPRIILKPKTEAILRGCLRYSRDIGGPIYHVRAVFYNKTEVLEKRDFLFIAEPNSPWIFCNLSPNKSQC